MGQIYIVSLSSKDKNEEYQFLHIKVETNDRNMAIHKAINYFYETCWSNVEWKKDEIELELTKFKENLNQLALSSELKYIPNKNGIIHDYERELRGKFGAVDKSISEFENMDISSKLEYLYDIGCDLEYFVYPNNSKFEQASI
jgi:hypothetical protein